MEISLEDDSALLKIDYKERDMLVTNAVSMLASAAVLETILLDGEKNTLNQVVNMFHNEIHHSSTLKFEMHYVDLFARCFGFNVTDGRSWRDKKALESAAKLISFADEYVKSQPTPSFVPEDF